jgi:Peptidase family M50/CBS domain
VWRSARFGTGSFEAGVAVLGYLAFVNAALLAFNLIPGYPLDGGQMLRAIVWWRTGTRNRATSIAARIGRGVSVLMIGFGLFLLLTGSLGGIWLAVIGLFLGGAARQTQQESDLATRIEGLRVADVMDAEPVAIPAELPLDRALDDYFVRYGWPWFPVVDGSGHLVGLVSRDAVDRLPEPVRAGRTVASAMAADAAGSSFRVGLEEPLEALLGLEGLQRLGAIMAVDRDGILRGIVTVDQVRRALQPVAT